jgi:hypothetical protein
MFVFIFRLMIQITNSQPSTLSHAGKNVRFLHSAFDNNGDSFVAGDHQGHIFLFDITKNRNNLYNLHKEPINNERIHFKKNDIWNSHTKIVIHC